MRRISVVQNPSPVATVHQKREPFPVYNVTAPVMGTIRHGQMSFMAGAAALKPGTEVSILAFDPNDNRLQIEVASGQISWRRASLIEIDEESPGWPDLEQEMNKTDTDRRNDREAAKAKV